MARSKRGDADKTADASCLGGGKDMRCAGNIPAFKTSRIGRVDDACDMQNGIGTFAQFGEACRII
jgi:hypothetical protein